MHSWGNFAKTYKWRLIWKILYNFPFKPTKSTDGKFVQISLMDTSTNGI